nr:MAG TPA: hypothetical protein [Caudoviricetes sp.]
MIFSVFFFCPLLYFMPTFVLGRKVKKRRNSILGYKMWPIVHEKFTIFGHLPTFKIKSGHSLHRECSVLSLYF